MKHTFLATLIAMLFALSVVSCGDKDDTVDVILRQQIRFVNETGTKPIMLTYWSLNQTVSMPFSNADTIIKVGSASPIKTPGVIDSMIVRYGDVKTVKYSQDDQFTKGRKSPCLYEYYEVEEISDTETHFIFTFTKDMIE